MPRMSSREYGSKDHSDYDCVFSILHTREKLCDNNDDAKSQFDSFINKFNKTYSSEVEKARRFEIFKKNILDINERNKQDNVYAINKFADQSHEEFSRRHTGLRADVVAANVCEVITDRDLNIGDVPAAFDWRDQIKLNVKDQLDCQSCWAFAATGSVEAQHAIRYKRNIILSEQQLLDCDTTNCGCNSGHPAYALRHLIQAGGQELEEFYPYVGSKHAYCAEEWGKMRVRVNKCFSFVLESEDKIRHALVKYGPLAGAVDADSWRWYRAGTILLNCTFNVLDHSILIVGYGKDKSTGVKYWTIKNSWGANWGDEGYIRVRRGVNACGIHNFVLSSSEIE